MNWADALQHCKLATKSEADNHQSYNRSWVGALQLSTPWMVHEECFYFAKSLKQVAIENNSPAQCSYHCRNYVYFGLKENQCMCDNDIISKNRVQPNVCDIKCSGSKKNKCGSNNGNYANVYKHVTGKDAPMGNTDVDHSCSVFKLTNHTVQLQSTKCTGNQFLLCDNDETAFGPMDYQGKTFSSAKQYCTLRNKLDMDTVDRLNLDDRSYWTGIHSLQITKWLETDSFLDMCDAIDSFDNIKCILIDWKSRNNVMEVPVRCSDRYPVFCSQTQQHLLHIYDVVKDCNKEDVQTTIPVLSHTYLSTTQMGLNSMEQDIGITSIETATDVKDILTTIVKSSERDYVTTKRNKITDGEPFLSTIFKSRPPGNTTTQLDKITIKTVFATNLERAEQDVTTSEIENKITSDIEVSLTERDGGTTERLSTQKTSTSENDSSKGTPTSSFSENIKRRKTTLSFTMENNYNHTPPLTPSFVEDDNGFNFWMIIGITVASVCIIVAIVIVLFLYKKMCMFDNVGLNFNLKWKKNRKSNSMKSEEESSEAAITLAPDYADPKALQVSVYADPCTLSGNINSARQTTIPLKELSSKGSETETSKLDLDHCRDEAAYAQYKIDHSKFLYDTPKTIMTPNDKDKITR